MKMKKRKEFTGKVISTSMKNTVVVEVERQTRHPLYRKAVKRTKHFAAHIEGLVVEVGDLVKIAETKPISKTKHFVVVNKMTKGHVDILPESGEHQKNA